MWNFKRAELALTVKKWFTEGLATSVAIIAPRRKGKTHFLLQDLSPILLAEYTVVYTSLWKNPNNPAEGILLDVNTAIANNKSSIRKLITMAPNISQLNISNELLGKAEIVLANNPIPASQSLIAELDASIKQLITTSKKPVVLMIDEIQHLATSPVFDSLSRTLRTILDENQGSIKSVFTGSSRNYMHALLGKSTAPFYNFSSFIDFPDLGSEYIDFLAGNLAAKNIMVAPNNLAKVFKDLDCSPYWMHKVIQEMVMNEGTASSAYDTVSSLMVEVEDLAGISENLHPQDRIVFLAVANQESPYSHAVRNEIDLKCTVQGSNPNIQRSLDRLQKQGLISNPHGNYMNEHAGLRKYLES